MSVSIISINIAPAKPDMPPVTTEKSTAHETGGPDPVRPRRHPGGRPHLTGDRQPARVEIGADSYRLRIRDKTGFTALAMIE